MPFFSLPRRTFLPRVKPRISWRRKASPVGLERFRRARKVQARSLVPSSGSSLLLPVLFLQMTPPLVLLFAFRTGRHSRPVGQTSDRMRVALNRGSQFICVCVCVLLFLSLVEPYSVLRCVLIVDGLRHVDVVIYEPQGIP